MIFFSAGDAPFFFDEQIRQLSWLPSVWDAANGFGTSWIPRLWIDYPFRLVVKLLSLLGFSWFLIEKMFWIGVFVLAVYSSYRLVRQFVERPMFAALGSVVYATNTYFLLLFGGGQMGVALAFAFAPFVFLKCMELIDTSDGQTFRKSLLNGLSIALLVVFDLRLAYLTIVSAGLYFLYHWYLHKKTHPLSSFVSTFIIPGIVAFLLHAFWTLPVILFGGVAQSLGEQFTSPGMLKFLSVADFSHALALLHPNWPENFFGKVYFLQPEFLILPILAFSSSIVFEKKAVKRVNTTLFFLFLALVGVFLAKGVNGPFGGIFQWMFVHVPGFVMFRDPVKFYLYIAIAYSVLISSTFQEIAQKSRLKNVIIFALFIVLWCFTLRPVFLRQMTGNFRPLTLNEEYVRLKDMLLADSSPSRTLWIPEREKFGFASDVHPALTSDQLFKSASLAAVIDITKKSEFMKRLAEAGVSYVIVPTDLEKRFFLNDYQFASRERDALIQALGKTSLKRDNRFSHVLVFKNDQFAMRAQIPLIVGKQQKVANIGLIISIATLVGATGLRIVSRRRN